MQVYLKGLIQVSTYKKIINTCQSMRNKYISLAMVYIVSKSSPAVVCESLSQTWWQLAAVLFCCVCFMNLWFDGELDKAVT